MKSSLLKLVALLFSVAMYAQSGHIMQGVGAVNMSMGGAATAQPLDISGALHWNPAAISTFNGRILKLDIGTFFSSPTLYSTVPEFNSMGQPTGNFFSGVTEDDRPASLMPNIAMVWGEVESKHTFGVSAFGISGFGVTFPESMTNPINMPQSMGGFGRVQSDYMLLQIGFAYAYEISETLSFGIQPTFDYARLKLAPNPTAKPNQAGWPITDGHADALGIGGQFGLYYDSGAGFKAGLSYKTAQNFSKFDFENVHLNGDRSENKFKMDYPAILSLGVGFSGGDFDLALDYRMVDYENTDGFSTTGWDFSGMAPSVAGFGWENIDVISAGVQYKGIDKLPLRFGYTYSSNPIPDEVTFFNIPATAIIKNAFQFGLSYSINDKITLDGVFHYGDSGGKTSGQLLNPMFAQAYPPYGAIPGSEVAYDMTTSMVMVGANYTFAIKEENKE